MDDIATASQPRHLSRLKRATDPTTAPSELSLRALQCGQSSPKLLPEDRRASEKAGQIRPADANLSGCKSNSGTSSPHLDSKWSKAETSPGEIASKRSAASTEVAGEAHETQSRSPTAHEKEDLALSAKALSEGTGRADGDSSADSGSDGECGSRSRVDNYWDEEDELEDYLRRKLAEPPLGSPDHSCSQSGLEEEVDDGGGSQAASASRGSEPDSPQLAGPELQRRLREAAQREGIGRAAPPEIKPMDGVLAKIKAIADAAAARAAQTTRIDLPPPSARKPSNPAEALPEDTDDDIIIESQDDFDDAKGQERAKQRTPSVPLRFAIGSETQQEIPLFEEHQRAYQEDQTCQNKSQQGISETAREDADGLSASEPGLQENLAKETSAAKENVQATTKEEVEGSKEEQEEEEEELELSEESSSSDEEEEDELDPQEARRIAMAEAKAMLQDRKSKDKEQYFEDEAEMSEDGGHSEDDSQDDEEGSHAQLLEDLIGHEKERKRDETLRAAAHAQWLAQQDEADVQRLMDGMKNGFRKPRGPAFLLDEGGSLADSRKRRAAVDAEEGMSDADSEGSLEDSGESDSDSESDEQPRNFNRVIPSGDLSDEEGMDALQRYQQQKALEASQADEQIGLDLLDEDSQALLSKVAARHHQDAHSKKAVREVLGEIEGGWTKSNAASFLGRTAGLMSHIRTNSQNNTRSYIFGRDNSNSAPVPEGGEGENAAAGVTGPTNFAGIKRAGLVAGRQLSSTGNLLNMLHKKSTITGRSTEPSARLDLANVLAQPKARITKLARRV